LSGGKRNDCHLSELFCVVLCTEAVSLHQGWTRDVKARERDETETATLTSRDRDETEVLALQAETRPRRDVCSSRDVIETLEYKFY